MQKQSKQQAVLAWHFLKEGNVMRDGKIAPADGAKLVFDAEPIPCVQGLHASLQPFDALKYAPGPVLCLVRCEGTVVYCKSKLVCTERTIIARIDATELLRKFARQQAMKVLHLWDAPEIVVQYLQTGDESLRIAARAAAAYSAAYDAVRAAYAAAAYNAAEHAAYAAEHAAYAAACAAFAAADAAANSAEHAAYAAARAAAYDTARKEFNKIVQETFKEHLTA